MKKIEKVLDVIEKVCLEICAVLLGVIVLTIFYQVIARKMGFSVTWVDETTRTSFVLVIFLGTISIARRGTHIRISSFVDMLPLKIRKITEIITYLAVIVMTLLFAYCCNGAANNVGDVKFSMLQFIYMRDFYRLIAALSIVIAVMVIIHIIEILTGAVELPDGRNKEMGND